jgi:arginase
MTTIRLLEAPYDSGRRGERYGAGVMRLLEADAAGRLAAGGATVSGRTVDLGDAFLSEVPAAVAVMRHVQALAAEALRDGAVPVLLSGNCGANIGVLAAHAASGRRVGMLWLDAHADLNTPDTTTSGFFDGMGLAMLTGRGWPALAATIPGFAPLEDAAVLFAGGHQLDDVERELLESTELGWLPPGSDAERIDAAIGALARHADAVHVHVDLDVHDPSEGRANGYAAPGGMTAEAVRDLIRRAVDRLPLASASVSCWEPDLDDDGRMEAVALALLELLGGLASTAGRGERAR